jgi:4-amino-4-deoxy-L-arabinose transferase-like glycosyltransferase
MADGGWRWRATPDTRALVLVLAIGVALRGLLMAGSTGILWPDSYLFHLWAQALAAGDPFAHDAFKTPLYAAFIAAFMRIFGETPLAGQLLIATQHLLGLGATALFYRLARRFFDVPTAFAGSLLFTAHTLLLFYETSVLSESLFVFILAALLVQCVRLLELPREGLPRESGGSRGADGERRGQSGQSSWWWRYAAIGATSAFLTLTRSVGQAFIVCILLAVLLRAWRSRRAWAGAALIAAVYITLVMPWAYVNSRTYGFWGMGLGRGLGLFIRVFEIDRLEFVPDTRYMLVRDVLGFARGRGGNTSYIVLDELNHRHGFSQHTADDEMYRAAMETIRAHPWIYAGNTLRNWRDQLLVENADPEICRLRGEPYLCTHAGDGLSNEMFPNVPAPGRRSLKRWIAWYFTTDYLRMWVVLPFTLIGIAVYLLTPRTDAQPPKIAGLLLIAAIVYFTAVPSAMQWPEERYRLPIDPLLFIFAAAGARAIATKAVAIAERLRLKIV